MNTTPEKEYLSPPMQTAMVFAARYAHSRSTGGTFAVTQALKSCWEQLDANTREQIIRESHDAQTNLSDWEQFRGWAESEDNIKITPIIWKIHARTTTKANP